MSRRVVFQTINDPDDVQLEEKEEEAEEKADEHEAYLQMIREQARREQNLERRLKRRRKAHGSVFLSICNNSLAIETFTLFNEKLADPSSRVCCRFRYLGIFSLWKA